MRKTKEGIKEQKSIQRIAIILVLALIIMLISSIHSNVKAQVVEPTPDQKVEYRAVECEENNGNKQLIIEVWIKKLNFKE